MAIDLNALKSTQSWAIPVPDKKEIPVYFKSEYDVYFKPDDAPYLLYNPRQDQFKNVSDEKLLCLTTDRLVVLSTNHKPFACRFEDVVCSRYEELLLAFSITISTETDEVRVEYNSACSDLFDPLLNKLRIRGTTVKDGRLEWQQMSKLAQEDLKFANYARQILRDSGKLIDSQYQAEIIYGHKIMAETSLLILTETELCLVKNERKDWIDEPVYGGIFSFADRKNVIGAEIVSTAEPGLLQMIITLKGNYQWKIAYSVDHRDHLSKLIDLIAAGK